MAASDNPPVPAPDPDRLNGWKEVASHLGKGVRTVQRWEKEYGLPVHRLGREGGEILWASRVELDDWMRAFSARLRDSGRAEGDSGTDRAEHDVGRVETPGTILETQEPAVAVKAETTHRGLVAAVVALVLVSGTALGWYLTRVVPVGQPPAPERAQFLDHALRVFDSKGSELWHDPFPFVNDGAYTDPRTNGHGGRLLVHDLTGDGSPEVIFGAYADNKDPSSGVYVYSAVGTPLFTIRPERPVTYGDKRQYSGPWLPYHVFLGPKKADGTSSLFVAFIGVNFPSVLIEVGAKGERLGEYWSNGYIEAVWLNPWKGKPAVIVAAANNDSRGASLAIFEDAHANGSAPAENAEFHCVDCPEGGPTHFFVFPRRDVGALMGSKATSTITEVYVDAADNIHALVGEGPPNSDGMYHASAWYTLGPDLSLGQPEPASGLAVIHDEFAAAKRLDHRFGPQDIDALQPVKRWDGRRFVEMARVKVE